MRDQESTFSDLARKRRKVASEADHMSMGLWARCPVTGLTPSTMNRIDEAYLDVSGRVDLSKLPDCNVFVTRSMAALAGFKDTAYFVRVALNGPRSVFHHRCLKLKDSEGRAVAEVLATHVDSAVAGGKAWHTRTREEARVRATLHVMTNVTSGEACGNVLGA